jgi:hypothetical protein
MDKNSIAGAQQLSVWTQLIFKLVPSVPGKANRLLGCVAKADGAVLMKMEAVYVPDDMCHLQSLLLKFAC